MSAPAGQNRGLAASCAHGLIGPVADSMDFAAVGTPEELVVCLAERGWSSSRVAELKAEYLAAGDRWPTQIPAASARPVGSAQLHAWLSQCVQLLGLDAVDAGVRDAHQLLDAEDRWLLADRPPHHGSVG